MSDNDNPHRIHMPEFKGNVNFPDPAISAARLVDLAAALDAFVETFEVTMFDEEEDDE